MSHIETIYFISHTHTDIGYTDHQNVLARQHLEFIDRAIELCEATTAYPREAQYKWTCEVAAFVEQYFQQRPAAQVDRFLKFHQEGRIAVNAMAYHWTPMLSPAAMVRSLYPAMRLRQQYGLRITSAMQCDVDGASWLWADLLPAIGINGLTLSINPYRGRRPQPMLSAFWWEGPGGRRLLTYNGPHYSHGLFFYGLGDLAETERLLPNILKRLEQRQDYPYDFLYAQITHPALVDNGPPSEFLSDFVCTWNEAGRTPRMAFVTVDDFLTVLHERYASQLPTRRGDWADWWADGVASSAYETSLNRTTEALLPGLDLLAAQVDNLDPKLIEEAYRHVSLYDEHTWGAFCSVSQPHLPFTKAQWNGKAGFAYDGFTLTHELLARAGRRFARNLTGMPPEGDAWRRWHGGQTSTQEEAESKTGDRSLQSTKQLPQAEANRFLVINPLGWTRQVVLPLPPDRGGLAPYNFLEAYLAGNYRDNPPSNLSGADSSALSPMSEAALLLKGVLPAFSYHVIGPTQADSPSRARLGEGIIENQWYKIEIDPVSGGLRSWYDKEIGRELVARSGPWQWGQYVYEWVDHPRGHAAIFTGNFADEKNFGTPRLDTPFHRQGPAQVQLAPVRLDPLSVSLEVFMQAPGARAIRARYQLPHFEKALYLDMVVDKEYVTKPEAVYIVFPFALENPQFHLDLNGVPLQPEVEQLPGSCRDWYGIQRWAEVGNDTTSIVVSPLDAPLVQVGGIQTGRWAEQLDAHQATLVSWAAHNHWDTNFRAGQSGELLFRYRFTSLPAYDPAAASRFAAEHLVPPIIVRVPGAAPGASGQFLRVTPEGVADIQLKQAADGRGVIVRAFNFTAQPQTLSLQFPAARPVAAWACSPIEDDGDTLAVENGTIAINVPSRSLACARVVFEPQNH